MKISRILFKPKWQDKDAGVRRRAVAHAEAAELWSALPEISRADTDATVRLAALRRLDDFELWRERALADADDGLRKAARSAYLERLCAADDRPPALSQRQAELDALTAVEIEHLACHAQSRDLRQAALHNVTRMALLAERAVSDPDAQLRITALQRIDDPVALARIADRTRKTDKTVSRRARELAHQALIHVGDAEAIKTQALALCQRIDALMRMPGDADDAQLQAIHAQWLALPVGVPETLHIRYAGSRALVQHALELRRQREAEVPLVPAFDPTTAGQPEQEPVIEDPAQQPPATSTSIPERDAEAPRPRAGRREIEHLLHDLDKALSNGTSAAQRNLHAQLRDVLAASSAVTITPELRQRCELVESRFAELQRWQHWSNQQRRKALCADIETLAASAIHPDALATRVREAREEWQRLDAGEGRDANTAASTGMARRFHALCHRVLQPARPYFSARKQLRNAHTEQTEQVLTQLEAVTDAAMDWAQLSALRVAARDALHRLDQVDPRVRTELARRLKLGIARTGALCEAHEAAVAQAKDKLIEQADALNAQPPPGGAAREAQRLQRRWQALGNGNRRRDQEQWRIFRAACNAIFERIDGERKDRDAHAAKAREDAHALLARFEALAAQAQCDAEDARVQLRELDAQWQALATIDRAVVQRQQKLHEAIRGNISRAQRQQRIARFEEAMRVFAQLRGLETGADQATALQWSQHTIAPFHDALHARFARLLESPHGQAEDPAARGVLVRLEFLAGIESPPADRPLRMNHQVQRLSARMRNAAASRGPEQELEALMLEWFSQAAAGAELESRFEAAVHAAIQLLP